MKDKLPFAAIQHGLENSVIYETNCIPMIVSIKFPGFFKDQDRDRAWDALRLIYHEAKESSETR